MIDSHCHLNFDYLRDNLSNIISNAKKNHITSILTINTDPSEFLDHYALIKNYKSIYISYGLHPNYVTDKKLTSKEEIIKFSTNKKVIGIGETGLDFFHSDTLKKEQIKVFEEHIEASISTNLPIIIHQRNSENEIIEILKSYLKKYSLKVVFHCFTGTNNLKKFSLDNGFYISLSGIITFKNAKELRDIIKDIPLSSILLETDSPYLSPEPYRGKKNEPSFVKHIGEYLSNFFNIPIADFINQTDDNFYKLFSKAIRYNEISL
tara:strand:- start:88 stop:879 length:792 start_codon:yes stop_codon:yes gene_type:complete